MRAIIISIILLCTSVLIYSNNYQWTKRIGAGEWDMGYSIISDYIENVYITGVFRQTVNFKLDWSDTDNKTSNGECDIFITKLNDNAEYLWTRQIGGTGFDTGHNITVDNNNNIYIAGQFQNTVDFCLDWGGSDSKSAVGGYDIFITKISNTGSYCWTKKIGGSDGDEILGLITDNNDNILITGCFYSSIINFADDWGQTENKTNSGQRDGFITKISNSGEYLWTKKIGANGYDAGTSIIVNDNNDIYLSGHFQGTVNFKEDWNDTDLKVSAGNYDTFITKLNNNGTYCWTKRLGGSGADGSTESRSSLSRDKNNNIYLSGAFDGPVIFDEDWGTSVDLKTNFGSFVMKISNNGNYALTKVMNTSIWCSTRQVYHDKKDNIFLTGSFQDTVNFAEDWGKTNIITNSFGGYDIHITKLAPDMSYLWTKKIGGNNDQIAYSLACNTNDSLYVTGRFAGTPVNFAEDWAKTDNISSLGQVDIFITKISPAPDRVTSLTTVAVATDRISLTWSDVPNETHYKVYQNSISNFSSAALTGLYSVDIDTCISSNMEDNKIYYFWIVSSNSSWQANSDLPSPCSRRCTLTSAPETLNFIGVTENMIALSWPTNKASYYVLKRSMIESGMYTTIYSNRTNSYYDLTVDNYQTYYYRVYGVNQEGVLSINYTLNCTRSFIGYPPYVVNFDTAYPQEFHSDNIPLTFRIDDPDNDPIDAVIQYKSDKLGTGWKTATIQGQVTGLTQGVLHSAYWNSAHDIGTKILDDIMLCITPVDENKLKGEKKIIGPLKINNVRLDAEVVVNHSIQDIGMNDNVYVLFQPDTSGEVEISIYNMIGDRLNKYIYPVQPNMINVKEIKYKDDRGRKLSSDVYIIYVRGCGVNGYTKVAIYK